MIPRSLSSIRNKLSSKFLTGGLWVLVDVGAGQGLRFLSSLLLTRLLYPEAFGLMAIVTALQILVALMSDVGIREYIIYNERNDKNFLSAAWSIQLIRGVILSVIIFASAVPVALFYDSSALIPLIMISALNPLIEGFKSITLILQEKALNLKAVSLIELAAQSSAIVTMVVGVLIFDSVIVLAIGGVVGALIKTSASYLCFKEHHSKFNYSKPIAKEMVAFGKWVIVSSAVSFTLMQLDKVVVGKWLSMDYLGIYGLAVGISSILGQLSSKLASNYFMPVFSEKIKLGPQGVREARRIRLLINTGFALAAVSLSIIGANLIDILYDNRYSEAGWMLQLLAISSIGASYNICLVYFMMANGDSFSQMKFQIFSASILIVLFTLGIQFGIIGMLIAITVHPFVAYPLAAIYARKFNFPVFRDDIISFACIAGATVIGWILIDAPVLNKLEQFLNQFMI